MNPPDNMMELPVQKKAPACAETPNPKPQTPTGILEYTPAGERGRWRIELAEEFGVRFGLSAKPETRNSELVLFHEALCTRSGIWLTLRRLFGIGPVIPPPAAHPDDLKTWTAAELAASLSVTPEDLVSQVDAARSIWEGFRSRQTGERAAGLQPAESGTPEPWVTNPRHVAGDKPPSLFKEDDVLREFGFPPSMFEMEWVDGKESKKRPPEDNRLEKTWFAARVDQTRKALAEPRGGAQSTARQALLNELYLRRCEQEMVRQPVASARWNTLQEQKQQLEETLALQHEKLEELFPESTVAGKVGFVAAISDLFMGYHRYHAYGDHRLIDRVHTVTELEWLSRQSLQIPEPRLRLGLTVHIIDAISGLHDPKYRPRFSHRTLRKLDAVGKAAIELARVQSGEGLIDLTDDAAEFPDYEINKEGGSNAEGRESNAGSPDDGIVDGRTETIGVAGAGATAGDAPLRVPTRD